MAARRLEMARGTAEAAVRSIGLGYDVAADVRLKYCKQRAALDPSLIELDRDGVQDIVLPGVPKSIKCDKGERMRFRSDVLSFQQMIRLLLVAADRYAIERLKLVCQSILCEDLNVDTVATTLALADQHNCGKLKDACLEYIEMSDAMDAMEATQGFKDLKETCPSLLVDALQKVP